MSALLSEREVLHACRVLFGPEPDISRGFLFYLQPSGAKSAYRKQAKENHPDRYYTQDSSVQAHQSEQFRAILAAYETLTRFFKEREGGLWVPDASPRPTRPRRPSGFQHRQETAADRTERGAGGTHFFYHGTVPLRVLELGRYLYYSGSISYWSLIEALTWQRKQRPVIGNVAARWGWLKPETIDLIVASRLVSGRFGEKAVGLGFLSSFQVRTLLYYQRTLQERIGKYFIDHGILSPVHLEQLVRKMHEHNAAVLAGRKCNARNSTTSSC